MSAYPPEIDSSMFDRNAMAECENPECGVEFDLDQFEGIVTFEEGEAFCESCVKSVEQMDATHPNYCTCDADCSDGEHWQMWTCWRCKVRAELKVRA